MYVTTLQSTRQNLIGDGHGMSLDDIRSEMHAILRERTEKNLQVSLNELAATHEAFFDRLREQALLHLRVEPPYEVRVNERTGKLALFGKNSGREAAVFSNKAILYKLSENLEHRLNDMLDSFLKEDLLEEAKEDEAFDFIFMTHRGILLRTGWRNLLDWVAALEAIGKFYLSVDKRAVKLTASFYKGLTLSAYRGVLENLDFFTAAADRGAMSAFDVALRIDPDATYLEQARDLVSPRLRQALAARSPRYLLHMIDQEEHKSALQALEHCIEHAGALPPEGILHGGYNYAPDYVAAATRLHVENPRKYNVRRLLYGMNCHERARPGDVNAATRNMRLSIDRLMAAEKHQMKCVKDDLSAVVQCGQILIFRGGNEEPEARIDLFPQVHNGTIRVTGTVPPDIAGARSAGARRLMALTQQTIGRLNLRLAERPFNVLRLLPTRKALHAYLKTDQGARRIMADGSLDDALVRGLLRLSVSQNAPELLDELLHRHPECARDLDPVALLGGGVSNLLPVVVRRLECIPATWMERAIVDENKKAFDILSQAASFDRRISEAARDTYARSMLVSTSRDAFFAAQDLFWSVRAQPDEDDETRIERPGLKRKCALY